ncbi:hypothetical protein NM208_g7071 [Fusarium decemcellulare]|uniref:Uncharacterized protein n=1 Tax=Fusarium decemcellulare TaxID=57161 RepID=A0ACC1SAK4_9HYPO|nr:hypothetical protein NM208_g7071 [Fusarium decemcellulare]
MARVITHYRINPDGEEELNKIPVSPLQTHRFMLFRDWESEMMDSLEQDWKEYQLEHKRRLGIWHIKSLMERWERGEDNPEARDWDKVLRDGCLREGVDIIEEGSSLRKTTQDKTTRHDINTATTTPHDKSCRLPIIIRADTDPTRPTPLANMSLPDAKELHSNMCNGALLTSPWSRRPSVYVSGPCPVEPATLVSSTTVERIARIYFVSRKVSPTLANTDTSRPALTPVNAAEPVSQAQSQVTAREIAAESLRKERAHLHLDHLQKCVEEMTQQPIVAHKFDLNEFKQHQTILNFHSDTLRQLLSTAFDAEISTLAPCSTDSDSHARLKRSITDITNAVHVWEHELDLEPVHRDATDQQTVPLLVASFDPETDMVLYIRVQGGVEWWLAIAPDTVYGHRSNGANVEQDSALLKQPPTDYPRR